MKKLLSLILLLTISYSLFAQLPIDPKTDKVTYTDVVNVDLTKDELFLNAKTWVMNTFKDYKETLQFEDKDAGKISIKGNFTVFSKVYGYNHYQYDFTLTIECKDYKYRYILTDITIYSSFIKVTSFIEDIISIRESIPIDLEALEKKDTSKLKKKEKEDYLQEIDFSKKSIIEQDYLNQQEEDEFMKLIDSLKKAMSIKDDF